MPARSRRAEFVDGVRLQLPLLLGVTPFGLAYGAYGAERGVSDALTFSMSWIVFGGASQFVAVRLIASGVPAAVIVLAVALVNVRHMLYSASIARHVEHLDTRWRWLLAYLLTDEAYAVSTVRYARAEAKTNAHWFFLGTGLALWACWQVSTAAGIFAGARVPAGWSLEFALPLTFIAIVVPGLRDRPALAAAVVAGAIAVVGFRWPYATAVRRGRHRHRRGRARRTSAGRRRRSSERRRTGAAAMTIWLAIIAAGVVTYGIRLSMIAFVHHSSLPALVRDGLRYVTPAALTAILLPAVLYAGENEAFSAGAGNERLLAAVVAAIIAWTTKSVWLTIGVGMGALWLLEWAG